MTSERTRGRMVERLREQGIRDAVAWYRDNPTWVANVRGGAYRDYYDKHYVRRNETW